MNCTFKPFLETKKYDKFRAEPNDCFFIDSSASDFVE